MLETAPGHCPHSLSIPSSAGGDTGHQHASQVGRTRESFILILFKFFFAPGPQGGRGIGRDSPVRIGGVPLEVMVGRFRSTVMPRNAREFSWPGAGGSPRPRVSTRCECCCELRLAVPVLPAPMPPCPSPRTQRQLPPLVLHQQIFIVSATKRRRLRRIVQYSFSMPFLTSLAPLLFS